MSVLDLLTQAVSQSDELTNGVIEEVLIGCTIQGRFEVLAASFDPINADFVSLVLSDEGGSIETHDGRKLIVEDLSLYVRGTRIQEFSVYSQGDFVTGTFAIESVTVLELGEEIVVSPVLAVVRFEEEEPVVEGEDASSRSLKFPKARLSSERFRDNPKVVSEALAHSELLGGALNFTPEILEYCASFEAVSHLSPTDIAEALVGIVSDIKFQLSDSEISGVRITCFEGFELIIVHTVTERDAFPAAVLKWNIGSDAIAGAQVREAMAKQLNKPAGSIEKTPRDSKLPVEFAIDGGESRLVMGS